MKGGGFLILFFLLICFLWGITSVVNRISRVFSTKSESSQQAEKSVVARERDSMPPMPDQSQQAKAEDDIDCTITQLERINQLLNDGALTKEEFAQIKKNLIQHDRRA